MLSEDKAATRGGLVAIAVEAWKRRQPQADSIGGDTMRYLRVYAGDDGTSRFEDVELKGTLTPIVEGVPPVLESGPFACSGIAFVEEPEESPEWQTHVALRKQWVIMISGRAAVTTSDGQPREVGPGDVILAEDTTGRGHLSTRLTADVRFAVIPCAWNLSHKWARQEEKHLLRG